MKDEEEAPKNPPWEKRCYLFPDLIRETRKHKHTALCDFEVLSRDICTNKEVDSHHQFSWAPYYQAEGVILSLLDV